MELNLHSACFFIACTSTALTFIGIDRLVVDLNSYCFISNERTVNDLFTATSIISVKS